MAAANDPKLIDDLTRVNELVSAIDNTTHKLAVCPDGTLLSIMHDGGSTPDALNRDINNCREIYEAEANADESDKPPSVFTARFRKDMMESFYQAASRQAIGGTPLTNKTKADENFIDVFCRSLVPGLPSLRRHLLRLVADRRIASLSQDEIDTFLSYRCSERMCASKGLWDGVHVNDDLSVDDPIPPPNVKHPHWLYYPEDNQPQYCADAVVYIKEFLHDQSSHQCSACDVDYCILDDRAPIDLFGLPETFRLNQTICAFYGLHTPSENAMSMSRNDIVIRRTEATDTDQTGRRIVRYSVHNLSTDSVYT